MLRLAFDFIITWRETRTRPNAYREFIEYLRSNSTGRIKGSQGKTGKDGKAPQEG